MVVSLFCNVMCGSLIDSNSQNMSNKCVLSSLKNNIRTLVLKGKGCRIKVYVQVQRERGLELRNLSVHTLWMTLKRQDLCK